MQAFTQRLSPEADVRISFTLSLSAEERSRSRYRFDSPDGKALFFRLPRGTVLQEGDLLQSEQGEVIRIVAKPEPVFTVRAKAPIELLRAAYHLGNRHIPLEVRPDYLRLSPDPVLKGMLEQLGVTVKEEIAPFFPEMGAYGHSH